MDIQETFKEIKKMTEKVSYFALAIFALIFLCAAKSAHLPTSKEIDNRMTELPSEMRDNEIARKKTADYLALEKKIIAAAKKNKLKISEQEIKEANTKDLRRNLNYSVAFRGAPQHRELSKILSTEEKPEISDEEVENYYNNNSHLFSEDEKRHVNHILVKTMPEAQEITKDLKQDIDFGDLAKTKSIDPAGRNGGNLGWVTKEEVIPELGNEIFIMKKDDIKTVKSGFGHHVVRLNDIQLQPKAEIEEVHGVIINHINQQRERETIKNLIEPSH